MELEIFVNRNVFFVDRKIGLVFYLNLVLGFSIDYSD